MHTERGWVKNNSNIEKTTTTKTTKTTTTTLSRNCIFWGEMLDTVFSIQKHSFYTKKKQNGRPTVNWIFDLALMASFQCCYCHKL